MNKEVIEQLQQQLNRVNIVPDTIYRRNHIHYALVCYLNNITGLYLSSNFEAIPLFINRAYEHMKKTDNHKLSERYADLVLEYLSEMAKFVLSIESMNDSAKGYIPSELL